MDIDVGDHLNSESAIGDVRRVSRDPSERHPSSRWLLIAIFSLLWLLFLGSEDAQAWWNASWPRRVKLTFDNSAQAENLTAFPVLVKADSTRINYNSIQSDGDDIRFIDDDDSTELYYEVESWNDGGTSWFWVKVPQIDSGSSTDFIYIYCGNETTGPTAYKNAAQVWSDNFEAVYHLNGNANDSTGNHNGSISGATSTTGQISGAYEFNGTTNYINTNIEKNYSCGDYTIEAWWNTDNKARDQTIVGASEGAYGEGATAKLGMDTDGGVHLAHVITEGNNGPNEDSGWESYSGLSNGTWYYSVFVRPPNAGCKSGIYLYRDGAEKRYNSCWGETNFSEDFNIGRMGGTENQNFDGKIDEVRFSNEQRSGPWIAAQNLSMRDSFITYGSEETPTAVTLVSFKAVGLAEAVLVSWATGQEIDNLGFYLYCREGVDGPWERLTDRLIPGGGSVAGKSYEYRDSGVTRGRLYYYKLEDIDIYGTRTSHGPVCVDWDGDGMPDDWELEHGLDPGLDDSGEDYDYDGLTNLEEYLRGTDPWNPDTDGDGILDGEEGKRRERDETEAPRALTRGVEIVSSDEGGLTLELRTDGFDVEVIEAGGETFERLRIPEYIHGTTETVGSPELPVKGILVDLPPGKTARLRVEGADGEHHLGYWVYPVPQKTVQGQGQMPHVAEVFAIDDGVYALDTFYPEGVARLGKTYTFRDQQKIQVLFSPLLFNPSRGELVLYKRIRIRLDYEDTPINELMGAGFEGRGFALTAWCPPSEHTVYKILTESEGIYRLTRGYLVDQDIDLDSVDLSELRLYNRGDEISIHVYDEDGDDRLDPEDYIDFFGAPVGSSYAKYARHNVYWLTLSGGEGLPLRMEELDGVPGAGELALAHVSTALHEEDGYYGIKAPGDDTRDRWYFSTYVLGDEIFGGGLPVDFSFWVPGPVSPGSLTLSMWGGYETDHQVDVSLNGLLLDTFTWSGIAFYEETLSGISFLDGENTVTLECQSGLDSIIVDWFRVDYERAFAAHGDHLKFSHDTDARFEIEGFSGQDLILWDITLPGDPERLVDFEITGEGPYTLGFEPEGGSSGRTYFALSSTEVLTPEGMTGDDPSTLSDPENGADYIVISHREIGWDEEGDPYPWLSDLLSHREAQGLRVKLVDIEDIYDEFSYGISTPQAIKDFLTYAYETWSAPAPRYVLLLGKANCDCKDNYGESLGPERSSVNFVPTYLTVTDHMGETITDEWYARVSGDDAVPDLYIGRLPARSALEASVMVEKILAYETTPNTKTWEKETLLVADNPLEAYETVFEAMNEDVASLIPSGMGDPFKGYLGDYFVPGDLTEDIKEKINAGCLVVHYSGHGSIQILAGEGVFDNADVAGLTNEGKYPLFVSMSCLSGYFGYPEGWLDHPSLAEELLRSEGKGALATFMPTGMTPTTGQEILTRALFETIFTEDTRVLGEAIVRAKETLLANGSDFSETSETFLLLGDPATELKVPLPRRPTGVSAESARGGIRVRWSASLDCNGSPVLGYHVYRSLEPGGPYSRVNASPITGTGYEDIGADGDTTYYYVVTSVDSGGDESVQSHEASATPSSSVPTGGSGSGGGCFISTAAGHGPSE